MSRAVKLAKEAQAIFKAADNQGRPLTADERKYVQELLDDAETSGAMEKQIRSVSESLGGASEVTQGSRASSMGERFVNSQGFKAIADSGTRGQRFTSGMVEVSDRFDTKGTLLEGSGSPGSGSGGGLVPVPQVVPGVVTTLFQPLRFEDLLSGAQATGNTVRYINEGTATNSAAGVAEAGTKPESTLGLSTVDEPIKKIATTITTSDEILEDVPAVQAFINGRLSLFVQLESERQLFRGAASSNEVEGLFSRSIPIYAGGTAAGNYAEQLFKAINGVRGSAFVEPDFIVIHPTDYQTIRLLKDTANQYLGGGPFLGSYGNLSQVNASGQITGATDTLWGKPVYVTSGIGNAGTALVGTSQAACVWSRGGLSVEATNSHASLFVTNEVAIRAERRLGLTVYRPSAFVSVLLS